VDGLLLFVLEPPPESLLEELGPIVLFEAEHGGIPSVVLDIASGARQALSHLRGLGHRRIAYLGVDIARETFRIRTREWERMAGELGVTPADRARYQRRSPFALQSARQVARPLLLEEPRPTALFCDDDLLAAGARLAAADLGLAVPYDLSIVGFAGTVLSEAATPALTTVIAPAERLGAVAMETLLATIEGRPIAQARTVLPVHLDVRGSSASPHGVRAPEER
jgi:LacI family transcriptional regulator